MAVLYSDPNQYNPKVKPLLTDIESVYQSLYNLLGTSKGERLFRPDFGIELDDLLFQIGTNGDASFAVLNLILSDIRRFEPRVIPDFSKSAVTPNIDENGYDLTLAFQIQGLGVEYFEFKGSFFR